MLIAAAALYPTGVTVFELAVELSAWPVAAVKLNASGVVSPAACVVTENVPDTPPIVSVAVVVVLNEPEEVSLTATLCPGLTVPGVVTNAPPLML